MVPFGEQNRKKTWTINSETDRNTPVTLLPEYLSRSFMKYEICGKKSGRKQNLASVSEKLIKIIRDSFPFEPNRKR